VRVGYRFHFPYGFSFASRKIPSLPVNSSVRSSRALAPECWAHKRSYIKVRRFHSIVGFIHRFVLIVFGVSFLPLFFRRSLCCLCYRLLVVSSPVPSTAFLSGVAPSSSKELNAGGCQARFRNGGESQCHRVLVPCSSSASAIVSTAVPMLFDPLVGDVLAT